MATVDSTWGWTADALGMADAGNSAAITWTPWLSSDGSPSNGCVQVTAGAKNINTFEDCVQPTTGYTWEVLGVPAGNVVTNFQVLSWNYKKAAATNLTSHSITMTFLGPDGGEITSTPSVNAVSLGTGTSAWAAGAAGTIQPVLAAYQASNTDTRLRLRYNLVTPSGGATPIIDTRFDTVVVRITYAAAAQAYVSSLADELECPSYLMV